MEKEQKIFYYNGENYQHLLVSNDFIFLAYISNGKVMGWGNKAIEIRNVDSATLNWSFSA
jgi:hypothetical protein